MVEIMNTTKLIVITGHSIGGAIASLLALWLLCHLQTICSVICITFGSPMLGNESFSRAILQERWAEHFCHVVSQHDIVPRLFFSPSNPLASSCSFQFISHLSEENKTQLFRVVLASLGILSEVSLCGRTTLMILLLLGKQKLNSEDAKEALKKEKKLGRSRNLNSANLAIGLSKINPLRAQIEWYKASCDNSGDQMGYYDSFKKRGASKRDFKVNMNRIKLAQFWDFVIDKLEANELPYDFHKRAKWINASQFYKLLVEPLDITE
ncbi:hypothetical protein RND71_019370 [Anisodus tanguticus]|uniref:Uncharacterized protein n=1 Tax=Anisodus tanguticus TaxID=243964 RepID=A0AAE1RYV7_9SOLA|nr:hypothetical protein RND71_019370 [Anisodus tanguticus]